MKDVDRRRDLDDDRENGTNGDDRKGKPLKFEEVRSFAKQFSLHFSRYGIICPSS